MMDFNTAVPPLDTNIPESLVGVLATINDFIYTGQPRMNTSFSRNCPAMCGLTSLKHLVSFCIAAIISCVLMDMNHVFGMGSTVIGIDFGSQFIKISYVAPGGNDPLPITLNDMSERKTLNAVAFRNDMPFVGPHALKPLLNQPKQGYLWLNSLLGKSYDDSSAQSILNATVSSFGKDSDRGTITVTAHGDEVYSIEYLCGLLISKLIEQTEKDCKKSVREAVVTVPPFFNQAQRIAVLDSAKIAGIKILSLVNDISAAALYYGAFIGSKTNEARHVVIIDSGASHTSAALVYVDPQHVEDGKPAVLVEVKKILSDNRLSGYALDLKIAEILQKKFSNDNGGLEIPVGKSLNRLLIEASKIKQILSANTDARANIEELVGEHHLSCGISRNEFMESSRELHLIASELVQSLFQDSDIGLDAVSAVIPIGGNSRVPFVRDNLSGSFGSKLQYGLNMDDTIAKGSAWYAAMLSNFKIKPTRFRDTYPYAVDLSYLNEHSSMTTIPIYQPHSFVNSHRGVSFKNIDYLKGNIMVGNQGTIIEIATDESVELAMSKFAEKKVTSKKLKFWVDLNSSGLVKVKNSPVVLVEYEETQEVEAKPNNSSETSSNDTAPSDVATIVVKSDSMPLKYSKKDLLLGLSPDLIQKYQEKYALSQLAILLHVELNKSKILSKQWRENRP